MRENQMNNESVESKVAQNYICGDCGGIIPIGFGTISKRKIDGHLYCIDCRRKNTEYSDQMMRDLLNNRCGWGGPKSKKQLEFVETFLDGIEETIVKIASEYIYWGVSVSDDDIMNCYHDKITVDDCLNKYQECIIEMTKNITKSASNFEKEYEIDIKANPYLQKLVDFIKENAEVIVRNAVKLRLIRVNAYPEDEYRNYLRGCLDKAPINWLRENLKLFYDCYGLRFICNKSDQELDIWFRGETIEETMSRLTLDDQEPPCILYCEVDNRVGPPSDWEIEHRKKWAEYFLEEYWIRYKYKYLYDDLANGIFHDFQEWCNFFEELKARPWPNEIPVDEILAMRFVYWVYNASAMIMGYRESSIEL